MGAPLQTATGGLARAWLALAALFAAHFAPVRMTNFGGFDEWLYLSLNSLGVASFPHAHRPLAFVWCWPAVALGLHLRSYYLVHAFYLFATGGLVLTLARRLGAVPRLAFAAGALCLVWAPTDFARLSTLQMTINSGAAFGATLAIVLFVESWASGRAMVLAGSLAAAAVSILSHEGGAAVLLAAPLLVVGLPHARPPARRAWLGAWTAVVSTSTAAIALPLLTSAGNSYQLSVLHVDLDPWRFAGRVLAQYEAHLVPLFTTAPAELASTDVLLAVAVFLVGWTLLRREGRVRPSDEWRRLILGLVLAGLCYAAFSVGASILGQNRVQILAAPWIGLALAAALGLVWRQDGRRQWLVAALAAWVVAVGTGRSVAMQRLWDEVSYFPAQRATLVQLAQAAPALVPHTLVVLIDDTGRWPASFSFRHAVRYLYSGRALGHVWGASDVLYPVTYTQEGIRCEPWPVLRGPWRERVTLHRYDEVVVVRLDARSRLTILDRWPPELPGSPPTYAPRARILANEPARALQAILDFER